MCITVKGKVEHNCLGYLEDLMNADSKIYTFKDHQYALAMEYEFLIKLKLKKGTKAKTLDINNNNMSYITGSMRNRN